MMRISTAGIPVSRERGFTYIALLLAIVVIGIMAGVAHELTWRSLQAEREMELLFRGRAYVSAIEGFYKANGRYPRQLQDLLVDPGSAIRHHIRSLYVDPVKTSNKTSWQLLKAPDGGIAGVASTSPDTPLKKSRFPKGLEKFETAKSYRDWQFYYLPRGLGDSIASDNNATPRLDNKL